MRLLALLLASIALNPCGFAQTNAKALRPDRTGHATKPETSHLVFVTEYIRELAAIENIRASGEDEQKQDPDNTFSNMIHTSTLFQLELGSQVSMLRGMNLDPPYEKLIPDITGFYLDKIRLWKRMSEIGKAFIGGPKPGIDYPKLGAEVPEIRANLEYIDRALFEATPMIFMTLIDIKEDSKGHASHLIITTAERQKLLDDLNTAFGEKLDQKNPHFLVGAASVLRGGLLRDFKCSDEPWD